MNLDEPPRTPGERLVAIEIRANLLEKRVSVLETKINWVLLTTIVSLVGIVTQLLKH